MKTQGRPWIRRGALLVALACVAAWAVGTTRRLQNKAEVAAMTANMKTVCVGRFLVDVPAQAEVSFSGGMLGGFELAAREESEAGFEKRVAARKLQLKALSDSAGPTDLSGAVETREWRISNITGRTLIFGRTRSDQIESVRAVSSKYASVETHAHLGGLSIFLSLQYADAPDIELSKALLSRLRIADKEKVPAVPGFCIGRADFVGPPPAHDGEHLVMHLGLPGHPDLSMALFSIAGAKPGPGLLSRTARVDAEAGAEELLRGTKLHAGRRTINGLNGEEVLERVREYKFTSTYAFNWETRGSDTDPLQPYLSLELQTGSSERTGAKPVNASLHQDALLVLWDSIASSFRLRDTRLRPPQRSSDTERLEAVATTAPDKR